MTSPVDRSYVSKLTVKEVCSFLREKVSILKDETVSSFEKEMIDGNALLELNTEDLKLITGTMGERKAIERLLKDYNTSTPQPINHLVQPVGSSSWFPHKFVFPTFSIATRQEICNKTITRATRTNIIQSLGFQVLALSDKPNSYEFEGVCNLLIKKYPFLRDPYGSDIGSWIILLNKWFSNKPRPLKYGDNNGKKHQDSTATQPPKKIRKTTDANL